MNWNEDFTQTAAGMAAAQQALIQSSTESNRQGNFLHAFSSIEFSFKEENLGLEIANEGDE